MNLDRIRSNETKYCRIPQWLYETGISLQAIATYGWLHGRYGHYDRVMPSYNRLAKELGVSRGSVIAYVKELVAVGAIRVQTSGAQGRQSNEYVIAFNEPFPVVTGQHSDQGVVSPLTATGQPADPGGQRAVQEEDVVKKTKKDSLSRPSVPTRTTARADEAGEREIKQPATNPAADTIVAAYTDAIHRPVSAATRSKLCQQAAQLLADGFPAAWIADRARELAERGWTDLAQHCDRSTVPTTRVPTDSRTGWCGQCTDPIYRTVKRPDGELTECDTCHPAAVARRRRAETGAAA